MFFDFFKRLSSATGQQEEKIVCSCGKKASEKISMKVINSICFILHKERWWWDIWVRPANWAK
jgi:hypothetical protein